MHPYIKKLRSKPDHVKKGILTLALVVSMFLVSIVWFYNLGDRFDKQKVAEESRDDVKPFTLLTNSVSDAFGNISASVGNFSSIKDKMIETDSQIQN